MIDPTIFQAGRDELGILYAGKGCSTQTHLLITVGIVSLILLTIIIGYGT